MLTGASRISYKLEIFQGVRGEEGGWRREGEVKDGGGEWGNGKRLRGKVLSL